MQAIEPEREKYPSRMTALQRTYQYAPIGVGHHQQPDTCRIAHDAGYTEETDHGHGRNGTNKKSQNRLNAFSPTCTSRTLISCCFLTGNKR